MRVLMSFIFTIMLFSCQLNNIKSEEPLAETSDSIPSTDPINEVTYCYRIVENVTIESTVSIPRFNADSIDLYAYVNSGGKYVYIKDTDGLIFFCTMLSEQYPAIFKEHTYIDYNCAKYRYFVFDDMEVYKENRNRIFGGVMIPQMEQTKVQEYLNSFKGEIPPPLIRTPNYRNSSTYLPIKREYDNSKGDHVIVIEDTYGNDSIIIMEPLPDISRFMKNRNN